MSTEIRLAFAHPSERAESLASDRPHDRISLRDHVREVEIGAFQLERGVTQRLCFNIVVEVRPYSEPLADDVDRILSYDRVTEAIDHELSAERLNLLETLAERVAERILAEPRAEKVFVRIEKLDRGPGALGVEIVRDATTQGRAEPQAARAVMAPVVVQLSNLAIASPLLPIWLDQLGRMGAAILTVGAPDISAPQSDCALVQRRIELLAIEQNAWMLAARDPRAVVVRSRTELDWGLRHDQLSVWAPSKMVLDSAHPPKLSADHPEALAVWFAAEMGASAVLGIGTHVTGDLPCLHMPATEEQLPALRAEAT